MKEMPPPDPLVRDLVVEFGLAVEEAEIIAAQARRMREVVAQLDELPLTSVEPAPAFQVMP